MTLYERQQKRHRCIEQTFGLYGRIRGWDDLREQHQNMYIIYSKTDRQSMLDACDKCSGLVHWDDPERWGGEGGSGWGTHVHPWLIHVNVWQKTLQYYKEIQFSLVTQSCLTLCNPMKPSTPSLPVHHQLPEFTQTHVHLAVMPFSHLIVCRPLLLLPPIPPSFRVFPISQFFA